MCTTRSPLASKLNSHRRLARSIALGLGLLAAAGVFATPLAHAAKWKEMGPNPLKARAEMAGRIVALAAHPTKANLVYAGAASGGVWRWDGSSWTPLTDHMPAASIGALALDPKDPNTIYAGTGESTYSSCSYYGLGIYKSTDGGETWKHYGKKTFSGRSINQIAISPATGEIFAALTVSGEPKEHPDRKAGGGLFRSTDGGKKWTRVKGLPENDVADVVFKVDDPKVMFATLTSPVDKSGSPHAGFYRSEDGGKSWKRVDGFPKDPRKLVIAVTPADSKRIYVAGGGTTAYVWVSKDAGKTFNRTRPNGFRAQINGHYDLAAVADPKNADIAFFGGVQVYRTTDAGGSYRRVTPAHPDIQRFTYDAGGTLFCGQDGGVHISSNRGDSWKPLNRGLGTVQIYPGGGIHPTNLDWFIGGLQDNGTVVRSSAQSGWREGLGGDGGYNAIHPKTPNVVFAEYYSAGNIHKSTNGGRSFRQSGSGINRQDTVSFLPPYVYHPKDSNSLFYATYRMYKSTNQGSSWSAISGRVASSGFAIRSIGIGPEGKWLYVTTTGQTVHVSSDGGKTFKKVLDKIHGPRTPSKQIGVAPWDPKTAFLGVWSFEVDAIRMTTDGGQKWKSIKGDLHTGPVNTADAIQSGGHKIVIIGTDRGVHAQCDLDGHWRRIGEFLPNTPVVDTQYDAKNTRLVAFTFGRGAWVLSGADEAYWKKVCAEEGNGDNDDNDDDNSGTDDPGDDSGDDDGTNGDVGDGDDDGGGDDGAGDDDDGDDEDGGKTSTAEDDDSSKKSPEDDDSQDGGESSEDDPGIKSPPPKKGGCTLAAGDQGWALMLLFPALWGLRRRRASASPAALESSRADAAATSSARALRRASRLFSLPIFVGVVGLAGLSACGNSNSKAMSNKDRPSVSPEAKATPATPATEKRNPAPSAAALEQIPPAPGAGMLRGQAEDELEARAPATFSSDLSARGLLLHNALRGSQLSVALGDAIDLSLKRPKPALDLRSEVKWNEVDLQRFVAQIPGGRQESVATEQRVASDTLNYRFADPGSHVLLFCTEERAENAPKTRYVYCNKTVVRVSDKEGRLDLDSGSVAGKAGEPVEIRALMSPDAMTTDSTLPVRVYLEHTHPEGQTLRAIAPNGQVQAVTIEQRGIANVEINQKGVWVLRYEGQLGDDHYIGDLVFEVI